MMDTTLLEEQWLCQSTGVSGSATNANALTITPGAEFQRLALVSARAAVVSVPHDVDALSPAQRRIGPAVIAQPLAAIRSRDSAHVSAGASAFMIVTQVRAL